VEKRGERREEMGRRGEKMGREMLRTRMENS